MRYNTLGRTDIRVSEICLGTMTWGSQNSVAEAHEQLDHAFDKGVNFIDTAELYPTTPLSSETYGDTERFIGEWLAKRGRRDDVVLATKVAGPGRPYIRNGGPTTPEGIEQAIDASLRRLKTDYVDSTRSIGRTAVTTISAMPGPTTRPSRTRRMSPAISGRSSTSSAIS